MGFITLQEKLAGKPGTGKPYAGFDVAGAGNVTMGAGLRPRAKALDKPPDPTVGAPVLDPTVGNCRPNVKGEAQVADPQGLKYRCGALWRNKP